MWSMLCLLAAVVTPSLETGTLAFGTHVRLSAAPRVDGRDAGSGASPTPRYAVPVHREGALLVFTYADGSRSASLRPGGSVTGTFERSDASWVHLRRAANRPLIRVHRGSVARVEVSDGRRYPMGRRMAAGLGIGLLVGAGVVGGVFATECSGGECEEGGGLALVFVGLSGATGLVLGTVAGAVGTEGWREVPLDALGTLPTANAMRVEGEPAERDLNTPEKRRDPGE